MLDLVPAVDALGVDPQEHLDPPLRSPAAIPGQIKIQVRAQLDRFARPV